MTTTNQAFIKAFRHDAPQAAPTGPAITGAVRPAAVDVNASLESATSAGERSALYGPRPAVTDSRNADSNHHTVRTPNEKQPLSSYLARPLTATSSAHQAETEFLRPGTTISSFQWPPVCRALTQRSGQQLEAVADRILVEAKVGRSLIGVLGLFPGRGATTTALCLAARLAGRDRRVILVDANFSSPRLASLLEAASTTGWQDVLKHGSPLTDAIIRARDDRFDLLALDSRKISNVLRLVGGLQAVVTAGVLRHAYECVLLDIGAFFDAASQPIILELARNMGIDGVLAVTGPEPADSRDLGIVAAHLGRSGCELLGTIENRVAKPQAA